ncbi:MAG: hypothetical protein Q8S13_06085 [Dehalococcoidia bacterium]|nr:hypothetical protein [Dehalococcoidia bacterium]
MTRLDLTAAVREAAEARERAEAAMATTTPPGPRGYLMAHAARLDVPLLAKLVDALVARVREVERMPGADRCETCDREDCPVVAAKEAFEAPVLAWHEHRDRHGCGDCDERRALHDAVAAESTKVNAAERDCHAHAVDWRARALALAAELRAARERETGLRAALTAARREHEPVSDDPGVMFPCPASDPFSSTKVCNCGAEEHNAAIDAMLNQGDTNA